MTWEQLSLSYTELSHDRLLPPHNRMAPMVPVSPEEDALTREKAIEELTKIANGNHDGDTKAAHSHADMILCDLLDALGYEDVVAVWDKIDKWYA